MPALAQFFTLCIALFVNLAGCVRREEFYPFGAAAGDQELAREDDGFSTPLRLEERFPYYDREESTLYVSSSLFPPLSLPLLNFCRPHPALARFVQARPAACACTGIYIGYVRMH